MSKKLEKLLADERNKLAGQGERRREEIQKKLFIQKWLSASPGSTKEQAEILWETFSKIGHWHDQLAPNL